MDNQREDNRIRAYRSCLILFFLITVLAPSVAASDAMFRSNPEHTGVYDNGGIEPTNNLIWQLPSESQTYSSPVVADGVVYIGNFSGSLVAVDATTGIEKWRFPTGIVHSSPAVSKNIVYVGCFNSNLCAIDTITGKEKWRFQVGDGITASPLLSNGIVFTTGKNGYLYAINSSTGNEVWRFNFDRQHNWFNEPIVSNNIVYIAYSFNKISAIDSITGIEKWRLTLDSRPSITSNNPSAFVIADNTIYFLDGEIMSRSDNVVCHAVDPLTGVEKWRFTATSEWASFNPSSLAVSDGIVFAGIGNNLYAIDMRTGKERWQFITKGTVYSSPAVANGVVYFGSYDNNLYAVEALSGKEKWHFTTEGGIYSSPAIANGVVYVGGGNSLYAIGSTATPQLFIQSMISTVSGLNTPSSVLPKIKKDSISISLIVLLIIFMWLAAGGYWLYYYWKDRTQAVDNEMEHYDVTELPSQISTPTDLQNQKKLEREKTIDIPDTDLKELPLQNSSKSDNVNSQKFYRILTIGLCVMIVIIGLVFVPTKTISQNIEVAYTATETYYEKEPYTVKESYQEQEPYQTTETYFDKVPVEVSVPYQVVEFYYDIFDSGSAGYYGTPYQTDCYCTRSSPLYIGTKVMGQGCVQLTCKRSRTVTKYRTEIQEKSIQKERPVTKYRIVDKTRDITKYRDVVKTRSVIKTRIEQRPLEVNWLLGYKTPYSFHLPKIFGK